MTVGELEELLALLPADMEVLIAGPVCRHVTRVVKHDSSACRHLNDCSALVDGRHPAHLVLRGDPDAPIWYEAFASDVEFTVSGRWPRKPRRA